MRIVAAMLVAVIWSSACYADDSYCDNQTIFSSRQEDGSTLSLVLTRTQLSSSPEWKPGTSEPPLSVAKAVTIGLDWAKKKFSRFDDVRVQNIDLRPTSCGRSSNRWYYVVWFSPVVDGETLHTSGHFAAVLMSGELVEPVKGKDF
ncbi:MAG TPA: hypothetical protein VFD64_10100 [Gemmatimonadaceae bacterium]|nr:hypothetical protein [Gemmatimonadaceae bacterium]